LDQHLKTECLKRAYKILHCGEKGTFASITEDHDRVCEKKIVACTNKDSGCSHTIEQGKIDEHVRNDCWYSKVACAYENLGCGVKMLRKDRRTHERNDRERHMDMSLVTHSLLADQLFKQHKELNQQVYS